MTIHVLVEGPSERAFLEAWAPRFLKGHPIRVHPHQGKGTLPSTLEGAPDPRLRGLLHQLPAKLRAFQDSLGEADSVLVLVDADNDDCKELADRIRSAVRSIAPRLPVEVRIAIEETEAFYLGDQRAIAKAYPSANLALARQYVPDSNCGTWELFGQVVDDDGGRKVAWGERMGLALTVDPSKNRSPSFGALCRGLRRLANRVVSPPKRRRFYHRAPAAKKARR